MLLGVFLLGWRQVTFVYIVPPLILASLLWAFLQDVGNHGSDDKTKLRVRLRDARKLIANSTTRRLVVVAVLRGMGFETITLFTPIYLANELKMGDALVGLHIALLTVLGIVALPALGILSDKFGRRTVLLPGLIAMALLSFALVNVGAGPKLTLVIAAIGIFSCSLNQVLRAAVLDLAPRGTEATSYGLVFGSSQLLVALSPMAAGALKDWLGVQFVFYYAAIVLACAALILVTSPLPRPGTAAMARP
jgi:predicted MFS family arabinose efflux permease